MKSKQFQELKNFGEQELTAKFEDSQKKLFELKTQKKITPLKNPLLIRELRRDMARMKTLFRQKFNRDI